MQRFLAVLALTIPLAGCLALVEVPFDEQIDIGTHSLHIYCIGAGTPAIVFDTGVGETYTSWQAIQEQLAEDTRVCGYDRAGYGQSEAGPLPRHSQQAAAELKLLLENAGATGPYLLVGHSLGGVNMQVFAGEYPKIVAGVVLLDPSPLAWISGGGEFPELTALFHQQTQELAAMAAALSQSDDPEAKTQAIFLQAIASEHEELLGASGQQASAIGSFGDLPLVVIASGQANPAFGEAFQQFWIAESRKLAEKSANGHFILAEESGHHIHQDAPDLVVEVLRGMLELDRRESIDQ